VAVETEDHYRTIVRELTEGSVVPLLGAGVNLCGRPDDVTFQRGGDYLPSGRELTQHLATHFNYPQAKRNGRFARGLDLVRVSQYVVAKDGAKPLYRELRNVFNADFPTTPVHDFFARLPARMRKRGSDRRQLILTTNYDDALERAFAREKEPVHVVWYIADPAEERGRFWHRAPGAKARQISKPNSYTLPIEEETVILKIHGAVDRGDPEWDSYVITEDHYIEYLTRTDISNLIPVTLVAKLRRSHFLFFGYSLREWNLRVILNRIWGQQALTYRSWALQPNPELLDEEFWSRRGVDILAASLDEYTSALSGHLELELPS
jgi:hypothetical protein